MSLMTNNEKVTIYCLFLQKSSVSHQVNLRLRQQVKCAFVMFCYFIFCLCGRETEIYDLISYVFRKFASWTQIWRSRTAQWDMDILTRFVSRSDVDCTVICISVSAMLLLIIIQMVMMSMLHFLSL